MFTKNKNYKLSFFMYFLLFGILVEIITIGAVYIHNHFNMLKQFELKYNLESSIKKNNLSDLLSRTKASIDSIIKNPIFVEYLNNKNIENTNLTKHLFLSVSDSHKNYMQVRYIDSFGNEKIRVDKVADLNSKIIKDDDLQNKSSRYYFKDTINTKKDQFWCSKLDLNIENGKIENPFKPTLRMAKKIIYKNEVKGIIIINLLMDKILKNLIKSSDFDIDLIDGEGNYIYSYKDNNSWSIDLKSNKNILHDRGLNSLDKDEFKKHNSYLAPIDNILNTSQNPYLVFSKKYNIIEKIKKQDMYISAIIIFFVLVVSIPIAYFISSIPLTLQKRLSDAISNLQKFSNIVDQYVMTMIIDDNDRIKSVSSSFCKISGHKKEDLTDKHSSFVLAPRPITKSEEEMDFGNYILTHHELDIIAINGSKICIEHTITQTLDDEGHVTDKTIIMTDIRERKEMEQKSLTDSLTKVYNRAGIDKFLIREIGLSKRHKNPLSLIIADIDFFKSINDTYGHQAGDKVLVELSNLFKSATRDTDIVGRFGGEEFIIILPQTDKKGSIILAENLRQRVEKYNFSVDKSVTVSFGITTIDKNDTPDSIIQRSDEALYQAKENGRNRVCHK